MEEYKIKLNVGEFKLLIGGEKPFYKTEGIDSDNSFSRFSGPHYNG